MPSVHPAVSIVIPTFARPAYLPRAVRSALHSAPGGNTEVLVVPNGPDDSWRASLAPFATDSRVRIEPVARANANVARNHGLRLALGTYVRFLDDDDQLETASACEQVAQLERDGAELSSGAVLVVDEHDAPLGTMTQADHDDLFCAMVRPGRVCLPTAHLFRRAALAGFTWDEALDVEQDTDWMMRLASAREWTWRQSARAVGRWTQHGGARVSGSISSRNRARSTTAMVERAVATLEARQALSPARAAAAAEALWAYAHQYFYRAPLAWTRIARRAQALAPASRPALPHYNLPWVRRMDPVLIEWALVPKRWANRAKEAVFGTRPPAGDTTR